jgi:hypothetical protein
MRTALAILRKDLRRFWWEIAITLLTLVLLSWLDAQRFDFVPRPLEALLCVFLPLAWAYLVAVVIQEDGPTGGRQFWMVRPISPISLVLAKAMFIVIAIQLPDFIADCMVVTGHGHPFRESLLPLLWKQVVLAAVVTLPAAALATVTEDLGTFLPAALATATGIYLLAGSKLRGLQPWEEPGRWNRVAGIAVLLIAAAIVLAIQFRARRTNIARWLGAAAILSGGALFLRIEKIANASEGSCEAASSSITIERTSAPTDTSDPFQVSGIGPPFTPELWRPTKSSGLPRLVKVPVRWDGLPKDANVRFVQKELEAMRSGTEFRLPRTVEPSMLFSGVLSQGESGPAQLLYLSREPYRQLSAAPFTLRGQAVAMFYRQQKRPVLQGNGLTAVSGVGRCSMKTAEAFGFTEMLKVYCESPQQIPDGLPVILSTGNREWIGPLGNDSTAAVYPWQNWLSPLTRRQITFFLDDGPGDRMRPPKEGEKSVAILTTERVGCANVSYELRDIRIGG